MRTNQMIFFAKLLILFSVVLITFGVVLQIRENKILHPVKDVTVVSGVDKDSITTVDDEDVIDSTTDTNDQVQVPSSEGNTNSGNNSTTNDNNSSNIGSGNSNDTSNNGGGSVTVPNNGNTNTVVPEVGDNSSNNIPVTPPVTQPTTEELNVSLKNFIESTYGVTVKYGVEAEGYSVGGMTTTIVSDAETCNIALNNLNEGLALYPSGFFREFYDNGYPLTFYLVKRYSTNGVTGVTDSRPTGAKISIAVDYPFADSLHHEMYHYIEDYILYKGFRFITWNTLNPSGFTYGTINQNLSYENTFSEDSYFVNNYAQTGEGEDRASTFEFMMKSTKASCLNYGKPVWAKARTMSEQIDYFLTSVTPDVTEYWERYVY